MGKQGWSRMDGWGAKGESLWTVAPVESPREDLGTVGGFHVLASADAAERVLRCEKLAALGKLGADEWMGTDELAKALGQTAED